MAGYGVPQSDIALVLDIDEKTLRKYYKDELDKGAIKANAAVAQSLYKKATGDGTSAVTAAIFWAKTRMGWKETVVNEHQGQIDSTIGVTDTLAALLTDIAGAGKKITDR